MEHSLRDRIVYLVDDDELVRQTLSALLHSHGYSVRSFPSAESFLEVAEDGIQGIMLLDLHMGRMSGMELQIELSKRGIALPIIFLTGYGCVQLSVEAVKNGAINFLEKPFRNETLLDSVREAFLRADKISISNVLKRRYASLSIREREVMQQIVIGKSSRNIAELFDISARTVDIHRLNVMRKMGAGSLPDLVRMNALCQRNGSD